MNKSLSTVLFLIAAIAVGVTGALGYLAAESRSASQRLQREGHVAASMTSLRTATAQERGLLGSGTVAVISLIAGAALRRRRSTTSGASVSVPGVSGA
jgi:hypothetical protein